MRIAAIGGGAAGMMCAAVINEQSPKAEVFLIEKNESLGKKVIISGGGRCNLTTCLTDLKKILANYPRGGRFLNYAMRAFPPSAVFEWFERHGVPLKCESNARVFPVSNKSKDVAGVFEKIFTRYGTKIMLNHPVRNIKKEGKKFKVEFKNSPAIIADKIVLALGGRAYRQTGSSGDGYILAENLGHKITKLAPSLSALVATDQWLKDVAGVSIEKAELKVRGKKQYSSAGPFVITHWGISGPAVFALSALMAHEKISDSAPLKLIINIIPEITKEQFTAGLRSYMQANPNKTFQYALREFIPLSLAKTIVKQIDIPCEKRNAEINKRQLHLAGEWVMRLPLNIIGRKTGDEFVTAGGVDLTQVNPSTMESKILPGLYFAGEMLNIDGFTGGFNLQACWATGHAAAQAIILQIK